MPLIMLIKGQRKQQKEQQQEPEANSTMRAKCETIFKQTKLVSRRKKGVSQWGKPKGVGPKGLPSVIISIYQAKGWRAVPAIDKLT